MEKLRTRILSKLIHKKPATIAPPPVPTRTPPEEIVIPEGDTEAPMDKRNQQFFIIGCMFFALICVLTGVMFYLKSQNSNNNTSTQPIAETTVESSVSAQLSNTESLNKSDWTFEVLNGSGKAGAAKTIADQIQNLGYLVLKTGNADKNNYPVTLLYISDTMTSKSDLLLADLTQNLNISTISGYFNDPTASARIIVGRN